MAGLLKTLVLLLVGLLMLVTDAKAQVIDASGDEICSCSPTILQFTLDFAGSCPGNIDENENDAIAQTTCDILVVSPDNQSNTQPVVVDTITILELNQNDVINSTLLQGPFADGDIIEYASISSYRNLTETYFPFGLQLILNGENSDIVTVINAIAIDYETSECNEWPVFQSDSAIGWIQIVRILSVLICEIGVKVLLMCHASYLMQDTVQDAAQMYCPAAPALPSAAPSLPPVVETTVAPVMSTTTTTALVSVTTAVPPVTDTTTAVPPGTETTTVVPGGTSAGPPIEGTTSAAPVDVPASSTAGPPSSLPATTDPGTATTAGPPVDGPIVSTTAVPPVDAPATATPVAATTSAPVAGGSTQPPVDGGTTEPPVPVAGPTIPPVDQPTRQPTPDEPPIPLPPIMFPTVDSPTLESDPPPATFSESEEDQP